MTTTLSAPAAIRLETLSARSGVLLPKKPPGQGRILRLAPFLAQRCAQRRSRTRSWTRGRTRRTRSLCQFSRYQIRCNGRRFRWEKPSQHVQKGASFSSSIVVLERQALQEGEDAQNPRCPESRTYLLAGWQLREMPVCADRKPAGPQPRSDWLDGFHRLKPDSIVRYVWIRDSRASRTSESTAPGT